MTNVRLSKSNIASELETFLENKRDDLSPNMFAELNSVFEYIDDKAIEVENELDELHREIEDLRNDIEELENKIDNFEF